MNACNFQQSTVILVYILVLSWYPTIYSNVESYVCISYSHMQHRVSFPSIDVSDEVKVWSNWKCKKKTILPLIQPKFLSCFVLQEDRRKFRSRHIPTGKVSSNNLHSSLFKMSYINHFTFSVWLEQLNVNDVYHEQNRYS